jgi:hypothetical protein
LHAETFHNTVDSNNDDDDDDDDDDNNNNNNNNNNKHVLRGAFAHILILSSC